MGLDNCLSSIKYFRCLSSLCHWYFSHSCATERRQRRSKNHVTYIHMLSLCVLKKLLFAQNIHFFHTQVAYVKLKTGFEKRVKAASLNKGNAAVNGR